MSKVADLCCATVAEVPSTCWGNLENGAANITMPSISCKDVGKEQDGYEKGHEVVFLSCF